MSELMRFESKEELLTSFTIYSMQSGNLDKPSASEYAKMMCSYRPEIGWFIREYGYAPRKEKESDI